MAAILNEHFVCIKVDREERPDIDHIYMTALQVHGRSGGWPLTMFLTPEAQADHRRHVLSPARQGSRNRTQQGLAAGTRQKVTGLLPFVRVIVEAWRRTHKSCAIMADRSRRPCDGLATTRRIAPAAVEDVRGRPSGNLAEQFDRTIRRIQLQRGQPAASEIPRAVESGLLARCESVAGDAKLERCCAVTLDHMARGGIRDHLGGGFHRYSTDRYWRVPHFEKMLYDNAQLAGIYAAAYKLTGDTDYRRVTDEMLAFVSRELTAPDGGFYSSLDAETDGDEGQFYVWSRDEVLKVLGAEDARLFGLVYSTAGDHNFERRYVIEVIQPASRSGQSSRHRRPRVSSTGRTKFVADCSPCAASASVR